MPKISFIKHDGKEQIVDAAVGKSVMQVAVDNMVSGIVGDCGGCCTCATCHAYIDDAWADKIPPASADELSMLDGALEVQPNSRLTCQVTVKEDMDGMIVRMPASQY